MIRSTDRLAFSPRWFNYRYRCGVSTARDWRTQVRLLLLLSVRLPPLMWPALAQQCARGSFIAKVTYVRDGDTIELGEMAIRLQGLAAPEWNEPGGTESRKAMIELAHGRTVRCELDGTRTYDRCVGVCYLDGADISEIMVRRGVARDCPRFSQGRYAEAERQAASDGAAIGGVYSLPGHCRRR
jgi:micrococcal nuclease